MALIWTLSSKHATIDSPITVFHTADVNEGVSVKKSATFQRGSEVISISVILMAWACNTLIVLETMSETQRSLRETLFAVGEGQTEGTITLLQSQKGVVQTIPNMYYSC